jgi:hypothetical protein
LKGLIRLSAVERSMVPGFGQLFGDVPVGIHEKWNDVAGHRL